MSRPRLQRLRERGCFPRVSGDEPAYTPGAWAVDMFSPRERG